LDSPYPYCRTKALAEQAVRDENCAGFETIVLRHRFIWGPAIRPSYRWFRKWRLAEDGCGSITGGRLPPRRTSKFSFPGIA